MRHSQWTLGLFAAEREYQQHGFIDTLVPYHPGQQEFCQGWNDYITHRIGEVTHAVPCIVQLRLDRIHQAYCRAVIKVNYAMHTQLEVLGILQRLRDKRRKLITKVYAYELTRNHR